MQEDLWNQEESNFMSSLKLLAGRKLSIDMKHSKRRIREECGDLGVFTHLSD